MHHQPLVLQYVFVINCCPLPPPGIFYNGLDGETPPERGTFVRPQVYERVVGILLQL